MQLTDEAKWFTEMFSELKDCNEEEQKQKIKEMNENVDGMNKEKFRSIFTKELFNKIDEMIEVKKLTMGNVLLLMKHIGFINGTKICLLHSFKESSLNKRFEKMIVIENIKKEEKNENFLANLCKFYLLLNDGIISTEMVSIIMPCLLKAASKKERNEETQKEVEIAFLALSHIDRYYFLRQELYLKEIKEIIQNHQEHYNLSRIGYQSAWKFLINRLFCDEDLERLIVNERHFVTEAAKELEELSKCVDWKKKKEEMSREEMKEANISKRWIRTLGFFIESCTLWNDEFIELIRSIIQVLRAAKENHGEISELCIYFLRSAAENRVVKIEDLLESEAVDAVLEEIK
eukprot:MONOS_8843.1-p1 / transcript=MONOS_8843.1 / gene=MONOS_8843 / organism=Monocercomonoides_exilis_PA203 / gene_product=unspecified product / transcript_product=unspecified product / location=Mono_scaffold00345:16604-17837(+) / protein_length=347 / sequence_SO=supercontig / SO=protein_coding / is_pseudo=false